ncbi:AAA family ATPase [Gemmatimonas sp. UBA7669]|uniref:AAA family ATPase n=1 Tax=Gemmatimonas sp. UBA7669 TaxID=1946568 RepID=UPI0025C12EF3|nr:AAA family ATPase [Gemmatimonas sp. UBA7669]
MKLVRLTAENFLRLQAVEIKPDGALVQISGRNGAGKSSVLRALEAALAGKEALPADPVRHGADEAVIEVDLGDFLVKRTVKADGRTTLTVSTPEGAKFSSPQKMLDGLLSSLAFDPLAFSRMKPREQRDTLANLVGLSKQLAELDAVQKTDFDERTMVNRDLRTAKARFEAMERVEPVEPVNPSTALAELRAAREHNARVEAEMRRRERERERAGGLWDQARAKRQEAARLLDEAKALDVEADAIGKALLALAEPEALRDVAAIEQRLEQAGAVNAQHHAYEQYQAEAAAVAQLEAASQAISDRMTAREAERAAMIQSVAFPLPGIGLTEDGVTLHGVPLDQASTAEQLRLSAAIGMALNPKLRLMVIRDGSLLDEDSLQLLTEAAAAEDFVLLVETVDTTGQVGIYIEDGNVRAVNGKAVAA